jgi:hypothetical protein
MGVPLLQFFRFRSRDVRMRDREREDDRLLWVMSNEKKKITSKFNSVTCIVFNIQNEFHDKRIRFGGFVEKK